MKNKQVTIKDLARKLGISTSTVSRALRGEPDVNPATKQQVLQLAKALHYEPNEIAQNLINRKTNTLGVVIPGYIIHFYAAAISGIQEEARKAGYHIIISQNNESYESELESLRMLIHKRVDGLLVSLSRETVDFSHFEEVITKEIPLVFFNRVSSQLRASKVFADDLTGGYMATRHLIEQGCRAIAHIKGPDGLELSQNRLEGYRKALAEAGLTYQPNWVKTCDFTTEDGARCTEELFAHPPGAPDGIFAVCDAAAYGALQVLKAKQIAIPQQVALIGYTDEPLNSLIDPPLSAIAQPIEEIGRQAAKLLIAQIGKKHLPGQTLTLPVELKVRASSLRKQL